MLHKHFWEEEITPFFNFFRLFCPVVHHSGNFPCPSSFFFLSILTFWLDEQEFKSSQFHLGLEAAAALRGVALQRGRVRAAAAASAYPAAAAAAAAAALARPQLTAASLQ